jgi:hypothetical protein
MLPDFVLRLPTLAQLVGSLLVGGIVALFFARLSTQENLRYSSELRAHEARVTKLSVGCQEAKDLNQATILLNQFDYGGLSEFSRTHGCRLFEIGKTGRIEENSEIAATSCLRPEEGEDCFWILRAAIQRVR